MKEDGVVVAGSSEVEFEVNGKQHLLMHLKTFDVADFLLNTVE
jgi:hypothetical protein